MTSYQLFASMPASLANEILEQTFAEDKKIYRATLEAVAQARKVRNVFLERQPRTERHAVMIGSLSRPGLEAMADNVIRSWLLKHQSTLLIDFLDALQIPHENGVVENLPEAVGDDLLLAAVESILAKHRADIAALYLHAFNDMNEAQWPNLEALLQTDERLKLTPAQ